MHLGQSVVGSSSSATLTSSAQDAAVSDIEPRMKSTFRRGRRLLPFFHWVNLFFFHRKKKDVEQSAADKVMLLDVFRLVNRLKQLRPQKVRSRSKRKERERGFPDVFFPSSSPFSSTRARIRWGANPSSSSQLFFWPICTSRLLLRCSSGYRNEIYQWSMLGRSQSHAHCLYAFIYFYLWVERGDVVLPSFISTLSFFLAGEGAEAIRDGCQKECHHF